jgi:hypothetical protein
MLPRFAIAAARPRPSPDRLSIAEVKDLQRLCGNQVVQRLLSSRARPTMLSVSPSAQADQVVRRVLDIPGRLRAQEAQADLKALLVAIQTYNATVTSAPTSKPELSAARKRLAEVYRALETVSDEVVRRHVKGLRRLATGLRREEGMLHIAGVRLRRPSGINDVDLTAEGGLERASTNCAKTSVGAVLGLRASAILPQIQHVGDAASFGEYYTTRHPEKLPRIPPDKVKAVTTRFEAIVSEERDRMRTVALERTIGAPERLVWVDDLRSMGVSDTNSMYVVFRSQPEREIDLNADFVRVRVGLNPGTELERAIGPDWSVMLRVLKPPHKVPPLAALGAPKHAESARWVEFQLAGMAEYIKNTLEESDVGVRDVKRLGEYAKPLEPQDAVSKMRSGFPTGTQFVILGQTGSGAHYIYGEKSEPDRLEFFDFQHDLIQARTVRYDRRTLTPVEIGPASGGPTGPKTVPGPVMSTRLGTDSLPHAPQSVVCIAIVPLTSEAHKLKRRLRRLGQTQTQES